MKILLILFVFSFSYTSYSQTELEYFKKGYEYYDKEYFNSTIQQYTNAINIDPNFSLAYLNRALAKADLGDNRLAIMDINIALKIVESNGGVWKHLNLLGGGTNQQRSASAYMIKAILKKKIGDNIGACSDVQIAATLNYEEFRDRVKKYCN